MTDLPERLRALADQDLTGSFYALLEEAADYIEETTTPSPENFGEPESGVQTSDMPGSAWANSTAEPNRYLHARLPRGAEARLAGEETGRRCGW